MSNKSILDIDQNIVAALSYLFGPFSGIIVLIAEKHNKFVRFHALQSTMWFLMLMIAGWIVGILDHVLSGIWIVGWILSATFGFIGFLLGVISLVSLVYLIYKAFTGDTFKTPIIGDVVWAQINK
ncbi:MAG: DUF4870 domain-containing protein [Clostridiales bacterium]|jgi:uncharacterized membrane protein|nr:DUF4870 domain-containing protein [Clostridiales bacterium]